MELETAVRKLHRIERDTLLVLLGLTLIWGIYSGSLTETTSVLFGGGLMLANFHFLWKFARRVFESDERKKKAFLAGLFFLYFIFLGAVAFVLLVIKVPLVPFFLGTLALLISIFLNSVFFM